MASTAGCVGAAFACMPRQDDDDDLLADADDAGEEVDDTAKDAADSAARQLLAMFFEAIVAVRQLSLPRRVV